MKKLLATTALSLFMTTAAHAITIDGIDYDITDSNLSFSELNTILTAIKDSTEHSVLKELGVTEIAANHNTVFDIYTISIIEGDSIVEQLQGKATESKFEVFYRALDNYLETKAHDWQAGYNAGITDGIASVTFLQSSYDAGVNSVTFLQSSYDKGVEDTKANPLWDNEDGISQTDVDNAVAAVKAEDYYFENAGQFENAAVAHINTDLAIENKSVTFGGDELIDVSSVWQAGYDLGIAKAKSVTWDHKPIVIENGNLTYLAVGTSGANMTYTATKTVSLEYLGLTVTADANAAKTAAVNAVDIDMSTVSFNSTNNFVTGKLTNDKDFTLDISDEVNAAKKAALDAELNATFNIAQIADGEHNPFTDSVSDETLINSYGWTIDEKNVAWWYNVGYSRGSDSIKAKVNAVSGTVTGPANKVNGSMPWVDLVSNTTTATPTYENQTDLDGAGYDIQASALQNFNNFQSLNNGIGTTDDIIHILDAEDSEFYLVHNGTNWTKVLTLNEEVITIGSFEDTLANIEADIKGAVETAYNAGYDDGFGDGYKIGYEVGFADGVQSVKDSL